MNKIVTMVTDLGTRKNAVYKQVSFKEVERYLELGWKFLNYKDEDEYYNGPYYERESENSY